MRHRLSGSSGRAEVSNGSRPSQNYSLSGEDYGNHVARRPRPQSLEQVQSSYSYFLSVMYLRVMDAVPGFVRSFAMPEMLPQWCIMLGRLRTNHVRPYDGTKPEDVYFLRRLWKAHCRVVFRSDDPFLPIDKTWKEMGFQDVDPSKDFRGGGRLSLEQLVYFAETYPADWDRMLGGDYLLAATGINVTLQLMSLLDIGDGKIAGPSTTTQSRSQFTLAKAREQMCRFIFDENINTVFNKFSEVYCAIMRLLFRRWGESPKNIMEFNSLLRHVYEEAERLLCVCESLDDFTRILR